MSKVTCVSCKSPIPTNDNYLSCHGCKQKYDLQCANLSPKRFKKMSQDVKIKWRCFECKSSQPKQDNTNTPPVRSSHLPKLAVAGEDDKELAADGSNVTMRRKADVGLSTIEYMTEEKFREIWKNEMKIEMESMLETTIKKSVSSQLKSINTQCTGFQESVSYISTQYEDLKKDNAELKKLLGTYSLELKNLKEENRHLRENLGTVSSRIKVLEEENMKQQQWVRLQNIEITGIPENKEEITSDVFLKISQRIGVNVEPSDLEFAHRVQPRRAASAARARPIIVRLRQRAVKDQIIAAARKYRNMTARDIGMGNDANKIYINEHLTKDSKMLLSSSKQKAKEANYKFIWTKNCRIYVRRNETSPAIPIDSSSDLVKIA